MRIEIRKTGKNKFSAWGKPTRKGEKRVALLSEEPLESLGTALAAKKAAIDAAKGRLQPS